MLFASGGGGRRWGATVALAFVRHFSRKRAEDVRRINPKVPREEAKSLAQNLYDIIKTHGPLTVSGTWNHAKDAGINGLNSKTHMKVLLKWMRGRNMLKLYCTHVGSAKKFLHKTLPEEPGAVQQDDSPASDPDSQKQTTKKSKKIKTIYKRLT